MNNFDLKDVVIRYICENDIAILPEWIYNAVKWFCSIRFLRCCLMMDPESWIIAELPGYGIIGTILGLNLNDSMAFGGFYIVKPEYRNQKVGTLLWDARLKHIGTRTLGVNAVKSRIQPNLKLGMTYPLFTAQVLRATIDLVGLQITLPLYKAMFHKQYLNQPVEKNCVQYYKFNEYTNMNQFISEDVLTQYDAEIHGSVRREFIQTHFWSNSNHINITKINQNVSSQTTHVLERLVGCIAHTGKSFSGPNLQGYGLMCEKYGGWRIGPLYAETEEIAHSILLNLLEKMADDLMQNYNKKINNINSMDKYCKNFPGQIEVETAFLCGKWGTNVGLILKNLGFIPFADIYRTYLIQKPECHQKVNSKKSESECIEPHNMEPKLAPNQRNIMAEMPPNDSFDLHQLNRDDVTYVLRNTTIPRSARSGRSRGRSRQPTSILSGKIHKKSGLRGNIRSARGRKRRSKSRKGLKSSASSTMNLSTPKKRGPGRRGKKRRNLHNTSGSSSSSATDVSETSSSRSGSRRRSRSRSKRSKSHRRHKGHASGSGQSARSKSRSRRSGRSRSRKSFGLKKSSRKGRPSHSLGRKHASYQNQTKRLRRHGKGASSKLNQ